MTDNFKAVYKILTALEACMDLEKMNTELISAKHLGVSEYRWQRYIEMMKDVGYIKGVDIKHYMTGGTDVNIDGIQITLKGLEYLQENSVMRRIYNAAKGIKVVIPGA